jgi:uncharacterized membrane protein
MYDAIVFSDLIRIGIAVTLALGLSMHGYSKKSLSYNGAAAAFFVGFSSFAVSYRFGFILILFYYTSSKLTKVKEDVKAKLEDGVVAGGQRGAVQVLACSLLGTLVCVIFAFSIGKDCAIDFGSGNSTNLLDFGLFSVSQKRFAAYLWSLYIAHYSCAAADTWASELGILSRGKPRLVTTLFLAEVPHGTNGGMSWFGTGASVAGGAFIGFLFWAMSFLILDAQKRAQYPMILVGLICGFLGSLIDSLLGATVQATYYSRERKCIVKKPRSGSSNDVECVCGYDLLSNEAVNFFSILLTMLLSVWIAPRVFCLCDVSQCSADMTI